ncbi:hypothetical protein SF83666_a47100 (plasmid) [Sinorhizobium fredii CCBAU 83666]|nr:hypothetical protein SF83666_a47100 [Sinorhizobium fredii CCBAU 83666]
MGGFALCLRHGRTSLPPDVFIEIAAGRSFVRPDDLATLAALIEQIERSHGG